MNHEPQKPDSNLKKILRLLLMSKRTVLPNIHFARMPILGILFRYFVSMMKSNFAHNVQGHRMYLDDQDTHYLSLNRIYEPYETRYFQNEVNNGCVVLDIGANIGYYTLIFAKQVGTEGHVFAFEPEPQSFTLLSKNVEINGYRNVTLVNKAVSNKTGKVKLFLSECNKGDHRIYDSYDGREFIDVDSITLDDYLFNFSKKIDFIKMDIQGAEYYALKGMTSLLQKNPNIVVVTEFEPISLLRSGVEPENYLDSLQKFGFHLYQIDENSQIIRDVYVPQLLQDFSLSKGLHTNLLCSKTILR